MVNYFILVAFSLFVCESYCMKFYAYPIGLVKDVRTGLWTKKRVEIPDLPFWNLCTPVFPLSTLHNITKELSRGNKKSEYKLEQENMRAVEKWHENSEVRLVSAPDRCPPGFQSNALQPADYSAFYKFAKEEFEKLQDRSFRDDYLYYTPKKDGKKVELESFSTYIAFDAKGIPPEPYGQEEYLGFDVNEYIRDTVLVARRLKTDTNPAMMKVRLMDRASRKSTTGAALFFNSDLQMGHARDLAKKGYSEGSGVVDFHLDSGEIIHKELVACPNENPAANYWLLYAKKKEVDAQTAGGLCIPVMLTTSPNQKEHAKDLWNQRQRTWKKYKLLLDAKPMYLSQYGIRRMYPGPRPVLYKLDDPYRQPITTLRSKLLREATPKTLDMDDGVSMDVTHRRVWDQDQAQHSDYESDIDKIDDRSNDEPDSDGDEDDDGAGEAQNEHQGGDDDAEPDKDGGQPQIAKDSEPDAEEDDDEDEHFGEDEENDMKEENPKDDESSEFQEYESDDEQQQAQGDLGHPLQRLPDAIGSVVANPNPPRIPGGSIVIGRVPLTSDEGTEDEPLPPVNAVGADGVVNGIRRGEFENIEGSDDESSVRKKFHGS